MLDANGGNGPLRARNISVSPRNFSSSRAQERNYQLAIASGELRVTTHCALIPYWLKRLGKRTLRARQISQRGGELFCKDRGKRIGIGGNAVTYLDGHLLRVGPVAESAAFPGGGCQLRGQSEETPNVHRRRGKKAIKASTVVFDCAKGKLRVTPNRISVRGRRLFSSRRGLARNANN